MLRGWSGTPFVVIPSYSKTSLNKKAEGHQQTLAIRDHSESRINLAGFLLKEDVRIHDGTVNSIVHVDCRHFHSNWLVNRESN